jgi:hypothetical protein
MPTNSGTTMLQGLTFPTLPDPASPDNQKELAQQLDSRVVMRFVSAAARDAAINGPVDGMTAHLADSGKLTSYSGGLWSEVGGPSALRPPCAVVSTNSTGAIATGSQVILAFQSADIDTHGMWSGGTDIVAPVAGIYRVSATVGFEAVPTVNGSAIVAVSKSSGANAIVGSSAYSPHNYPRPAASGMLTLAAGDSISLTVFQSTGAARNLYGIFGVPTAILEMSLVSL